MQSELAIQKLTEAREAVDGELADIIDTVARMVILQQEISHPILGAKVTVYDRPDTEERVEVDEEEAPEPDSDEWNWQWSVVYANTSNHDENHYWFTPKVNEDDPDLISHEAIVVEGNVGESAPEGDLWDPNEKEYKTADEYPVGTVNVVVAQDYHGEELISFSDGYVTDVKMYTSITPAKEDPKPHTYTPGWN